MSKFKLPKNSETFFASFKQILNCHFQFGHSSAQSPRELVVSVSLSVNLTSLRGYVSQTSPYLYVRGCYECPAQGEKAELKFDREIPSSCLTCTLTRCNACIHSVKDTYFSASVSVSLGLFLDKLLWHCCGFSCPAFALCGQLPQHIAQWLCHRVRWTRIHWVRWNKIGEEASRMLKSWQTKTYGTDILYDYENILPNSVTKCSKHNFWPVIFSLWMQMSVSHAVNAVIVVDKNNIYVLINT